ncbi:hypothetical protein MKK50_22240 [Methylobacterium sp. J-043]|nr:hypothetical protein [Methylobacterium sp. J-043]
MKAIMADKRGGRHDGRRGRDGFVLVLTLLMLGTISGALVALLDEIRSSATDVGQLIEEARARGVAQAAIVRAAGSVTAEEDSIKGLLEGRVRPVRWRFEGMDVELDLEAEGDKIDLNTGHIDLITSVLTRGDPEAASRAKLLERIHQTRRSGEIFPSVRALLEPCARMGALAARLERELTVLTRAQGIQLRRTDLGNLDLIPSITQADRDIIIQSFNSGRFPLDDRRLTHLRPYISINSPYYSFSAIIKNNGSIFALERQITVEFSVMKPNVRVVSGRWNMIETSDLCR